MNDTLEMAELEFSQELDWRDYRSSHEYSDDNEGTQNGSHTLDGETQVDGITELMTEDDVAKFLEDKGIPSHYSKVFKGTASKCCL